MKFKRRVRKKRKKKTHSTLFYVVETLFFTGLILFFIGTGIFMLWASSLTIPDIDSFDKRKVAQSTKIYDRTGEVLLFDVHENIRRTIIPFSDVSRHIKNATIGIEDAEFYEHIGIKPIAFLRAVLVNLQTGEFSQGGSTITQQVIKNSILTSEKKISRKLKEWVLAIKLEQIFTKDQVLELYLNESPYGGTIYGVEEASKTFFSKSAKDVTLAEAAYLAAIPQAPTYFSPYGSNKDALDRRKNLVLSRMFENGFIKEDEYEEAKIEEVIFSPRNNLGIQAPHFVMYIREYLASKYGERALEERGFNVITTLDYELQLKGEEIVSKFALENSEKFNASNAGLVAIDPKNGQILTMVGSRDYFDEEIDGNFNIALAERQPGSAFKPFVYATALDKGYTTETVVFDVETQFSTACEITNLETEGNCYSPGNYDNTFRGPVTMRNALAQSMNVPAVKFLYLAGLQDSLQTAKAMGIDTLVDIGRYGLTLVLGGGEVSLLDITSAYGVFANEGVRNPIAGILEITDSSGNVVEKFTPQPNRVITREVSFGISDMLSDNVARTPAFGSRSFLHFPGRDVAAKTGTTNDYRDAWIVGYTPTISVGAWAGNNDNSAMDKKVAGFIIAPLWNEFMSEAFKVIEDESFPKPSNQNFESLKPILNGIWEGSESYEIDTISGKLATEFTPNETREKRFVKDVHSILHWTSKQDPQGPIPANPERDPQYYYWEYAVNNWKAKNGHVTATSTSATSSVPTEFDDVHKPEYRPTISTENFDESVVYPIDQALIISVDIDMGKYPVSRVDYYVNGDLYETDKSFPFNLAITPSTSDLDTGSNEILIQAYDTVLNRSEKTIILNIE